MFSMYLFNFFANIYKVNNEQNIIYNGNMEII